MDHVSGLSLIHISRKDRKNERLYYWYRPWEWIYEDSRKRVHQRFGHVCSRAADGRRGDVYKRQQEQLVEERKKLQETSDNEKDIKKRLKEFTKTLEQNEVLDKFDRYVLDVYKRQVY